MRDSAVDDESSEGEVWTAEVIQTHEDLIGAEVVITSRAWRLIAILTISFLLLQGLDCYHYWYSLTNGWLEATARWNLIHSGLIRTWPVAILAGLAYLLRRNPTVPSILYVFSLFLAVRVFLLYSWKVGDYLVNVLFPPTEGTMHRSGPLWMIDVVQGWIWLIEIVIAAPLFALAFVVVCIVIAIILTSQRLRASKLRRG